MGRAVKKAVERSRNGRKDHTNTARHQKTPACVQRGRSQLQSVIAVQLQTVSSNSTWNEIEPVGLPALPRELQIRLRQLAQSTQAGVLVWGLFVPGRWGRVVRHTLLKKRGGEEDWQGCVLRG